MNITNDFQFILKRVQQLVSDFKTIDIYLWLIGGLILLSVTLCIYTLNTIPTYVEFAKEGIIHTF